MFGLPQAKRVRREDLYSNSRSPTSSPKPESKQLFLEHFKAQYEEATIDDTLVRDENATHDAEGPGLEEEEQEVEFRLFGGSATTKLAKIRLQSPMIVDKSMGLLRSRPRGYYFAQGPSGDAEMRLQSIALSGEDVYTHAQRSWPGCKLPWKVIVIEANSATMRGVGISLNEHITNGTKKRKGKKARIAARKQLAKHLEQQRIGKIAAEDKELAERLKKTKINRDKKLRQRAKEKVMKLAARAKTAGGIEKVDEVQQGA